MNNAKANISIGTSGWSYYEWDKTFYPPEFKRQKLVYYSKHYTTVELNASFYNIPSIKSFISWHSITPDNFKFSIKLNKYITHTKKLIIDEASQESIELFLHHASHLDKKLANILVQLPPGLAYDLSRLSAFINHFQSIQKKYSINANLAFEFRHQTWFCDATYQVLNELNCTLVISHSSIYPYSIEFPSSIAYIRFHGPKELYTSNYTKTALKKWANIINNAYGSGHQIYVYFNNTAGRYAIENSQGLISLLKIPHK